MTQPIDIEKFSRKFDEYFLAALFTSPTIKPYFQSIQLPTKDEVMKKQLQTATSVATAVAESIFFGLGFYKTHATTIRVEFKSCPIEYSAFAEVGGLMKGKFLFSLPLMHPESSLDYYTFIYTNRKGERKERNCQSHSWGYNITAERKSLLSGCGSDRKLNFHADDILARAYNTQAVFGLESAKADIALCQELERLLLGTDLVDYNGLKIHYVRAEKFTIGMIDFELNPKYWKWKEKATALNKSPQELVVSFFLCCSKIVNYIKKDFSKIAGLSSMQSSEPPPPLSPPPEEKLPPPPEDD